jgi:hypothetical protein
LNDSVIHRDALSTSFYPKNQIVAVFDDQAEAKRAADSLNLADLTIWSPGDFLALRDEIDGHKTIVQNVMAALPTEQSKFQDEYFALAEDGKTIVTVGVPSDAMEPVREKLAAAGAHTMRYYHDMTIENLEGKANPPQEP